MNEKEVKPHIEDLKKDPTLNEILNFTQGIFKKLPENDKVTDNSKADKDSQLNAETLNSLVTAAQSFINPTTLSFLSKTLNQSEIKEKILTLLA
ncbi:hypothetical protein [Mesobacillus boroniphilus]|uniref:Uncharacterized protein n=1 Tax=Mesobacillus boroniphilus JCM 21738 TaxID=1294265 RepID=W4RJP5_9BACI|nr:hypothetical protein [Mesobacillus boroniphilus]GAE44362.1 hypothetical protein JCM21738_1071 [Mesobacillus boroniphilus JCM 21738]